MYLDKAGIDGDAKILHIAPEKGIYEALSRRVNDSNYIVADIDPKRYGFTRSCKRIDLCNLENEPSCEYDIIMHLHVLEHIPCNIAYTLFHLHRMLKGGGRHICVIPFLGGKWDECFQELSDEERMKRFGQFDHVRRFGRDDIQSHLGKIVNVPHQFDATIDFNAEELRSANIPKNLWAGFHTATVLNLAKDDFKLR